MYPFMYLPFITVDKDIKTAKMTVLFMLQRELKEKNNILSVTKRDKYILWILEVIDIKFAAFFFSLNHSYISEFVRVRRTHFNYNRFYV